MQFCNKVINIFQFFNKLVKLEESQEIINKNYNEIKYLLYVYDNFG